MIFHAKGDLKDLSTKSVHSEIVIEKASPLVFFLSLNST